MENKVIDRTIAEEELLRIQICVNDVLWVKGFMDKIDNSEDQVDCFNFSEEGFLWQIKEVASWIFKMLILHDLACASLNL